MIKILPTGKFDGWNGDSQDGDNASVSIVSPDATDNKELAQVDACIDHAEVQSMLSAPEP